MAWAAVNFNQPVAQGLSVNDGNLSHTSQGIAQHNHHHSLYEVVLFPLALALFSFYKPG